MKTLHKNSERLVTKVFQDVFDKYDLMNDLMSLGIHRIWKQNLIDWLNPGKNKRLIDVASGTGDIAKSYLHKINYSYYAVISDGNNNYNPVRMCVSCAAKLLIVTLTNFPPTDSSITYTNDHIDWGLIEE